MTTSYAIARLRALRLLDPVLAGFSEKNQKECDWLTKIILERGDLDEPAMAKEVVAQLLDEEPAAIDGLFKLARELVELRYGAPICKQQNLLHHIEGDLDADLLVAACLAELRKPPEDEHALATLSWPSILAAPAFLLEQVLHQDMVDGHVHLGGALPGSFYWVALMSGFTPLIRMQGWELEAYWIERINEAQRIRRELFRTFWQRESSDYSGWGSEPWNADLPPEPFVDYIFVMLAADKRLRSKHNPILGERLLLWHGLAQMARGRASAWHSTFETYLQTRNSFIHYVTYERGYRGLARLRQHFALRRAIGPDRLKRSASRREQRIWLAFERFRMRHSLRYQFSDPTDAPWARDHGLLPEGTEIKASPWRPPRQVEMRVSPVIGPIQMRLIYAYMQGFHDFVARDRDAPLIRFGLTFHLLRNPNHQRVMGVAKIVATGLASILTSVPRIRPFVIGVDVASGEKTAPPRIFAPFYRSIEQINSKQTITPGEAPIQIKRTCHAGEDFDDLLTGLRYMDDSVRFAELHTGERLGHGLALAIEPKTWYARRHQLHKHELTHRLDLLWCHHQVRLAETKYDLERDHELGLSIRDLYQQSFGTGALMKRFEDLTDSYADFEKYATETELHEALGGHRKNPLMTLEVTRHYIELAEKMQERVRRRISKGEIVLEVCPTSNMLVGNFGSYKNLPYLNLNRTGLADERSLAYPVLLTLNTDNPGNFKTTIANEYRLMSMALQEQGLSTLDAVRWLNTVRETGIAATFIPSWSPPTKQEFLYRFETFFRN